MTSRPTPLERRFLRAIAAVNPHARPGRENWWSADDLRTTALFPDFRHATVYSLAALGRSSAAKGLARAERAGTRGHGPMVYRISAYGRGLVADSCIGGGLSWGTAYSCRACGTPARDMHLPGPHLPDEVPAHPLPGYQPVLAASACQPDPAAHTAWIRQIKDLRLAGHTLEAARAIAGPMPTTTGEADG